MPQDRPVTYTTAGGSAVWLTIDWAAVLAADLRAFVEREQARQAARREKEAQG